MIQRFQEFPCFPSLLFIKCVRYFWLHVFMCVITIVIKYCMVIMNVLHPPGQYFCFER